MYYSGPWRGYWEQDGYGRQLMTEFSLRFASGRIEGEGTDVVGRFVFEGVYDEHGYVTLIKQYLGLHQVLYQGSYDGEGTIFGEWSIGPMRGKFALTPERHAAIDRS